MQGLSHNKHIAIDQLEGFLSVLSKNKELLNVIRVTATANKISDIAT